MNKLSLKNNKGFTLVETLFAVLILTFTITGLMTIVANSLFSARYAKDEITANYLLQEVIDYVRNDRDTTVFLKGVGDSWSTLNSHYANCLNQGVGCYIDVLTPPANAILKECNSDQSIGCPFLYYDETKDQNGVTSPDKNNPFYVSGDDSLDKRNKVLTNFKRKIVITNPTADEMVVTVTVSWKNGSLPISRSLSTSFMNWQK